MAQGLHYSPPAFPVVAGLDGVGRLDDGTRVAFFLPQRPYGGMAEKALVRRGMWLPVPKGVDDVLAAGCLNPGMAAWKTVVWEATWSPERRSSSSARPAPQAGSRRSKAVRRGARVVVAGRNSRVLDELETRGAAVTVRVDRPHDELATALAARGPYDLVVDYLWGAPAEAVFTALIRGPAARRTRYSRSGSEPARRRACRP